MADTLVELYNEVLALAQEVIKLQNEGRLPPLVNAKILERDGQYYLFNTASKHTTWLVCGPDGITIADGPDFNLVHPVLKHRAGGWSWDQLQNFKTSLKERIVLAE